MDGPLTVIVGGGAAGMVAAISKARHGEAALICERLPQLGKKVLATGNGRCNLMNDDLTEAHYNPAARPLVRSVFDQFGKAEILALFKGLGLQMYSQDGRIFPITNQAGSVLKVLQMEMARLGVPIEYGFTCTHVTPCEGGLSVSSSEGRTIRCQKVVIAGGGKTYPVFGTDGSIYEVAQRLGHSIVRPVPVAVPLLVKDPLCHLLQGQRLLATARAVIDGVDGREADGELLFTRYGLSGTCILDVSEPVSIAFHRHGCAEVFVSIDLVPFMTPDELASELGSRRQAGRRPEEMLVGLLPNRCCLALAGLFEAADLRGAVSALKARRFRVLGTRGWGEAEFTAGGVDVREVWPNTLESRLTPGVYFAGEVLDVNGARGGYNLAWAWASGYVAGLTQ